MTNSQVDNVQADDPQNQLKNLLGDERVKGPSDSRENLVRRIDALNAAYAELFYNWVDPGLFLEIGDAKNSIPEWTAPVDEVESNRLKMLFDSYGSDKAMRHNYHLMYPAVLRERKASRVLEVGIGSVNPTMESHMPEGFTPGASLRAWRDYFDADLVVGLDVDRDTLIQEDRIRSAYFDQTKETSELVAVLQDFQHPFDLIVDDGIHLPRYTLRTLYALWPWVSSGGAYVIEDIHNSIMPVWDCLHGWGLLPGTAWVWTDLREAELDVTDNVCLIIRKIY